MFRLVFVAMALGLCAGCSSIREGAERVESRAAAVGDRIEDRAAAAGRKVRTLWDRIFGGGDESSERVRRKPTKEEENALRLKVESQPYVGAEGPQTP